MKKVFYVISLSIVLTGGYGQTNTFPTTGNVGIGTTSPLTNLEVYSPTNTELTIRNENYTNGYTLLKLDTKKFASPGNSAGLVANASGAPLYGVPSETFGIFSQWRPIVFSVGNGSGDTFEYMRITQFGSLIIGKVVANSSYKLDVNGRVRANEIVVNTTGADFVFDPGYTLTPLTEVETYIKENRHLPEIPSAKEMQERGIALGEVQTKLLQKIEELTLYLIEQNKKLEAQQKIIENQSIRLHSLENK